MTIRLLVAEDETELVNVYKIALPRYGIEVVDVASSGREAVEKYLGAPERFDAILMDHRMPGMSGLEASAVILQKQPEARIVFGSADAWMKSEALETGATGFLQKPFEMAKLREALEKKR